ncbi:MAG: hypothetical protein ACYC21_02100 [Eubacteriales bacterium]
MQPLGGLPAVAGGLFFLVWLAMMIGMVVGYVVIIIAVWRGMKAHESIAGTLKEISDNLRTKP